MTKPPGWPRSLPDPEEPEFPAKASQWLLDSCPPGYRGHLVLRRYPLILARLAAHHARGNLTAAREAYAGARRELAEDIPPEAIEATLVVLTKEGAVLAGIVGEVELVEQALAGRRWRPKM
jgi:hypothetical protein